MYISGDCLCPSNQTGGQCQPGYYCPVGSYEPTPCPEGKYCDNDGLGSPAGNCNPGYYCSLAAIRPDPQNDDTGGLCPPGRYCGMFQNQFICVELSCYYPLVAVVLDRCMFNVYNALQEVN